MGRGRIIAILVGLVMVTSACGWTQSGYDAGRSANNSLEKSIGVANVASLVPGWSTGDDGLGGAPVEFGGRVFAQGLTHVRAMDSATGRALWSAPLTPLSDTTVYAHYGVAVTGLPDGRNVVISADSYFAAFGQPNGAGGELVAYDAQTGTRLWSQPVGPHSPPLIIGSTVFVISYLQGYGVPDFNGLVALDTATGAIKFRAALGNINGSLASVGKQLLVVGTNDGFEAVSANGCGAAMCPIAWRGVGGGRYGAHVAASGGTIYASSDFGLEAYAATGCGASTCAPTWTGPGEFGELAIANGFVFVGGSLNSFNPSTIHAFRAAGCGSSTCTAQWTSSESTVFFQPIVANGVLYAGAIGGSLRGWPAAGCGSTTCSSIFSLTLSGPDPQPIQEPIVADGRLYAPAGSLHTYTLPHS